jgi:hypothetical protein
MPPKIKILVFLKNKNLYIYYINIVGLAQMYQIIINSGEARFGKVKKIRYFFDTFKKKLQNLAQTIGLVENA